MYRLLASLTFLTVVAGAPALAQQQPPVRVGRVSFVSGNLAFHTAGETEWSAATVNYPVATGASLWTDAEARAEIRIGPDTIEMASSTALDVAVLDDRATQLNVPQGRIYIHLRRLDEGQSVEVDIPGGAVQPVRPGYYDIDAGTPDQAARIGVFEGSARFVGGGADIAVKSGDVAMLSGISPVTAALERAAADAFVEWCRSRDYDERRLVAPYHVSPNMTGYAELDSSGRWDTAQGYGDVWYPNVPAGWVPYADGRWVWIAPWGWTWVDAESWRFAPCHYGRWALIGESWAWVPGAFEPSPVYAPALVGFLSGSGVGLYFSGAIGPQVGWFPLAPGEVYWPSYASDPSYIRRLNQANVADIDGIHIPRDGRPPADVATAVFVNRRFATVVPQHVFAGAGRVAPAALHPAASALERAPITMWAPQIRPAPARGAPSRTALLPSRLGTAYGSPQPGQPTGTAAVPPLPRPGEAPVHPGITVSLSRRSFTGQENHPTRSVATHLHAPAPAFHAPAQAYHAPAHAPQQVARVPQRLKSSGAVAQAPRGGGAAPARSSGDKGDRHD